jgi:hypothetical protein
MAAVLHRNCSLWWVVLIFRVAAEYRALHSLQKDEFPSPMGFDTRAESDPWKTTAKTGEFLDRASGPGGGR